MLTSNQQILSKYQETVCLPNNFFTQLLKSQQKYHESRDKQSMSILLAKYTDLVAYFQAKHEPATQYFQAKIKQIIANVKYFTNTTVDLQLNKAKMNKDMYTVMESQFSKAQQNLKQDMDKQRRMSDRVHQILKQQNTKLDMRIKNSRRSHVKNYQRKNTLSFVTLSSTPAQEKDVLQKQRNRKNVKKLVSSSCVSQNQQTDDIRQYFEQGAIITTIFSQNSDSEDFNKSKPYNRQTRYNKN